MQYQLPLNRIMVHADQLYVSVLVHGYDQPVTEARHQWVSFSAVMALTGHLFLTRFERYQDTVFCCWADGTISIPGKLPKLRYTSMLMPRDLSLIISVGNTKNHSYHTRKIDAATLQITCRGKIRTAIRVDLTTGIFGLDPNFIPSFEHMINHFNLSDNNHFTVDEEERHISLLSDMLFISETVLMKCVFYADGTIEMCDSMVSGSLNETDVKNLALMTEIMTYHMRNAGSN